MENFCKTLRINDNNSEPLFEIDAILSSNEILMRPTPSEIYNIIIHSAKDFLERLKSFARWMDGTCKTCKPYTNQYIYSFFEDIISIPNISEILTFLKSQATDLVSQILKYLSK